MKEEDRKKLILTRMLSETREENALTRGHVTRQSRSTQLVPANLYHKDYQGSLENCVIGFVISTGKFCYM